MRKLVIFSLCVLIALSQVTTTTVTTQSSTLNNQFSNGGLGTSFPIGPTNLNFLIGVTQSFYILLTPGQTTSIYLANGLMNNDYSIYPLAGFSYSYKINGAPNWVNFDTTNNLITAFPPVGWTGSSSFNISYSDNRSNSASIPVTFSQGSAFAANQVTYAAADPFSTSPNIYTIIYPLFTTTTNSLTSIVLNNYGVLTNVGVRPWTNLQPIARQGQTFINQNPNLNFNNVGINTNPGFTINQTNTTTTSGPTIPNNNFLFSNGNNAGTAVLNTTTTTFTSNPTTNPTPSNNFANLIPIVATPNTIPASSILTNPSTLPNGNLVNSTTTTTTITGPTSLIQNLQPAQTIGTTTSFPSNNFQSSSFSSSGSPTIITTPTTQTVGFNNGATTVRTTNQQLISGTPQQINAIINSPNNNVVPTVISP